VPPRSKLLAVAGIALVALGAIAFMAWRFNAADDGDAGFALAPTTRAVAPFSMFDEARVAIDKDCKRLLIARSQAQRVQGLRDVTDLAPYDGMLFVFPSETTARFTMANTPMALDITFLDANGVPVDSKTMEPCPDGGDASCPQHASDRKYRYALEVPAGGSGGALGTCSA
jgi:uncharacterized membrane protein (UPF0127 family)